MMLSHRRIQNAECIFDMFQKGSVPERRNKVSQSFFLEKFNFVCHTIPKIYTITKWK